MKHWVLVFAAIALLFGCWKWTRLHNVNPDTEKWIVEYQGDTNNFGSMAAAHAFSKSGAVIRVPNGIFEVPSQENMQRIKAKCETWTAVCGAMDKCTNPIPLDFIRALRMAFTNDFQ